MEEAAEESKGILESLIYVNVTPVIEEMEEGETVRLTAKAEFEDGTPVDISSMENIKWNWTGNGAENSFTITPAGRNTDEADFTLNSGEFMDIIITAELTFDVPDMAVTRAVSRTITVSGDNQVPIMVVNEDDRRISDIPMINPHNLEGVGMGQSPRPLGG